MHNASVEPLYSDKIQNSIISTMITDISRLFLCELSEDNVFNTTTNNKDNVCIGRDKIMKTLYS